MSSRDDELPPSDRDDEPRAEEHGSTPRRAATAIEDHEDHGYDEDDDGYDEDDHGYDDHAHAAATDEEPVHEDELDLWGDQDDDDEHDEDRADDTDGGYHGFDQPHDAHDAHDAHDEHGHDDGYDERDDHGDAYDDHDDPYDDHDHSEPVPAAPRAGGRRAARDDDRGERPRGHRFIAFTHRHRILCGVVIVLLPLFIYASVHWVQAITKEGSESFVARNAEFARDMGMGFAVDWIEQRKFEQESNDVPIGGQPEGPIGPAAISPSTTAGQSTVTTKPLPPHANPPLKMATPAGQPLPNEGEWFPAGVAIFSGGFA